MLSVFLKAFEACDAQQISLQKRVPHVGAEASFEVQAQLGEGVLGQLDDSHKKLTREVSPQHTSIQPQLRTMTAFP